MRNMHKPGELALLCVIRLSKMNLLGCHVHSCNTHQFYIEYISFILNKTLKQIWLWAKSWLEWSLSSTCITSVSWWLPHILSVVSLCYLSSSLCQKKRQQYLMVLYWVFVYLAIHRFSYHHLSYYLCELRYIF